MFAKKYINNFQIYYNIDVKNPVMLEKSPKNLTNGLGFIKVFSENNLIDILKVFQLVTYLTFSYTFLFKKKKIRKGQSLFILKNRLKKKEINDFLSFLFCTRNFFIEKHKLKFLKFQFQFSFKNLIQIPLLKQIFIKILKRDDKKLIFSYTHSFISKLRILFKKSFN